MYKTTKNTQHSFLDFNQPLGLHMNPKNRWIDMAARIPWDMFESKYAEQFPSDTGNVAKPLRMALGSLIIQKKFRYPDRELIEQICENPYLQYFIGLPGYQEEAPFDASTLVLFRKRITMEMLAEVNNYLLDEQDDNDPEPPSPSGEKPVENPPKNEGTLILDATCAPANIRYPQDVSLLNEAREKLECIIARFCKSYGLPLPRRYRRRARKDFLAFAKGKRHSSKQVRQAIRRQLSYVRRDLGYLGRFMSNGYAPSSKEAAKIYTIMKLYEQQEYMYKNKTHHVDHRIVSLSQPWLRPIVRGKVNAPVEFGIKLDVSLDTDGYARIETASFEAYNESVCLQDAVERYKERTGRYPERVLVDQIYRTKKNRDYCKLHSIRMSGPKRGRKGSGKQARAARRTEYQDNTDRIAVEREFSVEKHSYGLGLIVTKLEETQLHSIALSVFVSNLFKIQRRILSALLSIFEIVFTPADWVCATQA